MGGSTRLCKNVARLGMDEMERLGGRSPPDRHGHLACPEQFFVMRGADTTGVRCSCEAYGLGGTGRSVSKMLHPGRAVSF